MHKGEGGLDVTPQGFFSNFFQVDLISASAIFISSLFITKTFFGKVANVAKVMR